MSRYAVHIDYFATDLTDLKLRDKRDPGKVLDVLRRTKRFSCFEIDRHLAPTIDRLIKSGRIKTDPKHYPWTDVEVIG